LEHIYAVCIIALSIIHFLNEVISFIKERSLLKRALKINTIIILLSLTGTQTFAQTNSMAVDSVSINKTYLGILGKFSYDSTHKTGTEAGFRAGIELKARLFSLDLGARLIYNSINPVKQWFWLSKSFGPTMIKAGHFARPIAMMLRPSPFSPESQLEDYSTALIPALAPGLTYNLTNDYIELTTGVYFPTKESEYNGSIKIKTLFINIGFAGLYSKKVWGIGGIISRDNFSCLGYMNDSLISSRFSFSDASGIYSYFGCIYNRNNKKIDFMSIGINKKFNGKIKSFDCSALIGAEYQIKNKLFIINVVCSL
jgi:hypothetical protein